MAFIDPTKCFDCGAPAEENHHVIPKSLGGTKTVPLCVRCHDLVHGGLGRNRIQHKELTKRGLNKKMSFDFYYVWWHHFKCNDEEGDWKDVQELADDLEIKIDSVKKRISRIKEMDSEFIQELSLPYMGYDYYGTKLFNLDPYNLTDDDILLVKRNRSMIEENIIKELAMSGQLV